MHLVRGIEVAALVHRNLLLQQPFEIVDGVEPAQEHFRDRGLPVVQGAVDAAIVLGWQRKLLAPLVFGGVDYVDDEAVVLIWILKVPAQTAADALQIQAGVACRPKHGDQIQGRQVEAFGQAVANYGHAAIAPDDEVGGLGGGAPDDLLGR